MAVENISFSLDYGECFALLGVNGAGKSSTFDCLAGYSQVSGGTVMLDGKDVCNYLGNPQKLHGLVGFCPQTNIFADAMTVRQSVTLVCRLVGIPDYMLTVYVESTIIRFGLSRFIETQA